MATGFKWSLVIYALVEEHAQRPPVDFTRVAFAFVYFGGEIGECARFARQRLVWYKIRGNVLHVSAKTNGEAHCSRAYEICEMDMSLRV